MSDIVVGRIETSGLTSLNREREEHIKEIEKRLKKLEDDVMELHSMVLSAINQ